jgi:hypothetical protein
MYEAEKQSSLMKVCGGCGHLLTGIFDIGFGKVSHNPKNISNYD